MFCDPGQRAAGGPHHGVEARAVAANTVAAGEERRIDGRPAGGRRVEDIACTRPRRHRYAWLEHLGYVEFASAERLQIVRHRSIGPAIDLRRSDTLHAQTGL